MIYSHQFFQLDSDSKKVFDENERELYLTGNAYRLFFFLCDKGSANITEINEYFDPAGSTEYKEDNVRQYRQIIKIALGRDLVEYKNYVYSIKGEVKKTEKIQKKTENEIAEEEKVKHLGEESKQKSKRLWIFTVVGALLLIAIIFIFSNRNKKVTPAPNNSQEPETTKPPDDMLLITAGEFLMGSTEQQALEAFRLNDGGYGKEDYLAEYPQRKITLSDYLIDRKEISNADYKLFMDATNHQAPSSWNDSDLNAPTQPAVGVDWNEASAYCAWLGKRLPTEAEWEKAARGTDGRNWPWGNDWDPKMDNHGNGSEYGFDDSDGFKYSSPVGADLGSSPYGVLNVAGNAYEWTANDYNAYPGNDKYAQEDFNEGYKVIKGGAYTDGQSDQRPASRIGYQKDYEDVDIGFRCVKDK